MNLNIICLLSVVFFCKFDVKKKEEEKAAQCQKHSQNVSIRDVHNAPNAFNRFWWKFEVHCKCCIGWNIL